MKWRHCDQCSQTQRFSSTCSQCGEEGEEVEIERDFLQLTLPFVGIPLLFIGVAGFLAREFAYDVVGGNGACCSVLMVLYVLGLCAVLSVSIAGFITARNRVRKKAAEEAVVVREAVEFRDTPIYDGRRGYSNGWDEEEDDYEYDDYEDGYRFRRRGSREDGRRGEGREDGERRWRDGDDDRRRERGRDDWRRRGRPRDGGRRGAAGAQRGPRGGGGGRRSGRRRRYDHNDDYPGYDDNDENRGSSGRRSRRSYDDFNPDEEDWLR